MVIFFYSVLTKTAILRQVSTMHREFSLKQAVVALLLVVMLVFSVPVELAVREFTVAEEKRLAQNEENVAESIIKPQSTTPLQVQPEITTENTYKEEETMPGGDTAVSPDDIIPDTDDNIVDAGDGWQEKEGVTVIPAVLNNFMRDSLPSVISKKAYTFTLDRRGAIIYAFNHMEETRKNGLWYITLYEEYSPDGTGKTVDYRVVNRTSYESIGVGVKSAAIGVLPGNYRVEVECITGYTEDKYNIFIGFAENNFYEAEPNNTKTRYNELPVNVTVNGSASVLPLGEADVDTYLFRITRKGYTVLYFEHETDTENIKDNVAWKITLTDEKGREYFYTSSTMEKAMIGSGIMGLPEGYYFVTVSSHIYSNVEYSLNVSFTADSAIESELNDTPENAEPIAINSEKIGAITSRYSVADKDYYSFTMENDGFVVVDLIHEALTEDKEGWNVTILDANGKVIFNDVSKWNQPVLQTPNIGLQKGDYFIRIDADDIYHNSLVYRLILLTVQNTNWETEPNNSAGEADILQLGSTINGTMVETGVDYDRDWFRVSVEAEKEIRVTFGHIKTEEAGKEGWIVSLVDSQGNILRTTSVDWDVEEKSFSCKLGAGDYYVVVETGLYFNSNRYILSVT